MRPFETTERTLVNCTFANKGDPPQFARGSLEGVEIAKVGGLSTLGAGGGGREHDLVSTMN